MRIAQMLRLYRATQGLSQQDLAAEIGLEKSTMSRIENGKSVQMDSVVKLLHWLFREEETPP